MSQSFVLWPDANRARVLANLQAFLARLPDNKPWKIEIKQHAKRRSDEQNAALWACAYPPLMEHIGLRGELEREELHEFFCGEFWGWHQYAILGKAKQRPRRTTTRDEHGKRDVIKWDEFCDFYAFVQQRGAEAGVFIPDPDPDWKSKRQEPEQ